MRAIKQCFWRHVLTRGGRSHPTAKATIGILCDKLLSGTPLTLSFAHFDFVLGGQWGAVRHNHDFRVLL
jgi:hypothetical protein